jgi:hypothetical protein
VRELASEALDGRLARAEADAFQAHLASCLPCLTFCEELRESIALLDELPAVEVGDEFNEAVWARVGAEAEAAAGRDVLRPFREGRLAELWEDIRRGYGLWRWSPVGVAAAAVAAMFALAPEPGPGGAFVAGGEAGAEDPVAPSAAVVAEAIPAAASELVTDYAAAEEEVVAEMPAAIEEFLRNAERLRLRGEEERYRRSNYSYPLRRVSDSAILQVSGGAERGPQPVPTPAAQPEVISF